MVTFDVITDCLQDSIDTPSDLLRMVRLDRAYFYSVEAAEPWIVESAHARELRPQILACSEHLIAYHILTEGHCYVRLMGGEPVEMLPGDVIVFPHRDPNVQWTRSSIMPGL